MSVGLLAAVFVGSALLTLLTPEESGDVHARLGYPTWLVIPLGIAKLLGVGAILWARWPTLTTFAYAGFFYDLVLALSAHIRGGESDAVLAGAALLVWTAAFVAELRDRGAATSTGTAARLRQGPIDPATSGH